jgi:hypothetical protein
MSPKKPAFPHDRTEHERRKNLTDAEIKELELAGGVEGGMQAGSGGPPTGDERNDESIEDKSGQPQQDDDHAA